MKSARRLLVHERWLADWVDNQRKKVPATGQMYRELQAFGPEGDRLITAARADIIFGGVIVLVGLPVPLQNVATGLTCEFTESLTRHGGIR